MTDASIVSQNSNIWYHMHWFLFLASMFVILKHLCVIFTVRCWRCVVKSTQSWRWLKRRRGALRLLWLTSRKPCCSITGHNENSFCQLSAYCRSEGPSTKRPPGQRIKPPCLCSRFSSHLCQTVEHYKTLQVFEAEHSKIFMHEQQSYTATVKDKSLLYPQILVVANQSSS